MKSLLSSALLVVSLSWTASAQTPAPTEDRRLYSAHLSCLRNPIPECSTIEQLWVASGGAAREQLDKERRAKAQNEMIRDVIRNMTTGAKP